MEAADVAEADSELATELSEAAADDAAEAWDADAEDKAEDSDAEMEDCTEDCDAAMEDRTDDSEAMIDEASVVTGTGTAVVPSAPVEVLSVYAGEDAGTGMTVVPEEPEIVLDVLVDSSDARDEAALESTLENSEASELDTAESVAVAATLESSELSEDAKLESALEAAAVTDDGTLVVSLAMLEASESTEDWADETTLEASEATEETRPERLSVLATKDDEAVGAVPVKAEVEPDKRLVSEAAVSVGEPDVVLSAELVTEASLPVAELGVLAALDAVRGTTYVPALPESVDWLSLFATEAVPEVTVALALLSGNETIPVISLLDVETVSLPLAISASTDVESEDDVDAADERAGLAAVKVMLVPAVREPTRMDPVYELELADVVTDESAELLLLLAVGETTLPGTAPVLDWLDAVSVTPGRAAKTVAEREEIEADDTVADRDEIEAYDTALEDAATLLELASYAVG
ncbi:hypothetical protein LTR85_007479 [Meristemomyces frigidus]|nr:hypothetical protein LTR85_007479 [Meristemomyces frigidus]